MTPVKACHAPGGWEEFAALLAILAIGSLLFALAGLMMAGWT